MNADTWRQTVLRRLAPVLMLALGMVLMVSGRAAVASVTDGGEDRWDGVVLARPAGGLTGEWTILGADALTLTVTADDATRFEPADPAAYDAANVWVEVDGVLVAGQSIQATRIRIDEYEDSEIVVRMQSRADLDRLLVAFAPKGLEVKSELLSSANIYLLSVGDEEQDVVDAIEQVKDSYGVIWVELNYIYSAPEGEGYKTWGWGKAEPGNYTAQDAYRQVGLPPVLNSYDGQATTVAILDTGIYSTHEQFQGRLTWPSLDVIDDDMAPDDRGPGLAWGHGTHVAGIVAVMAPSAQLLPVRVLDSGGRGNTFLLAYAIEWAVDQGASVINLSLGTDGDSEILRDAIGAAVDAGVVVVAAAGNSGLEQIQYPAGYEDVLGVSSVTYMANERRFVKSSFANYGAAWVDLSAPGEGVMSTMIGPQGAGYALWSGTSMATAFVSGAAALAQQKLREQAGMIASGAPRSEAVIDLLVKNASPIVGLGTAWDGKIGGLLDVDAALLPGSRPDANLLYLPALPHAP